MKKTKKFWAVLAAAGLLAASFAVRKQCISKCRKQQRFRSIIFRRRQLRIGFW